MRKGTQGNVLYEHNREFHPGRLMGMEDFFMEVVDQYQRPVVRLSREGLQITHTQREMKDKQKRIILMNSKAQFYQPAVVRSTYTQGLM